MESSSKHLEASSEVDVPPRSWTRLIDAAEKLAARLFPARRVALRIVSDDSIRRLNQEFRGLDQATDVLSFPAEPVSGSAAHGAVAVLSRHAGDIALSWETARRQALVNGNSSEDECIALIAHGLLHLAGYDHETDAQDAQMQKRADELLGQLGLNLKVYGH